MRAGTIKMRINRIFQDYHSGKTKNKKPGNTSVSPELLKLACQGDSAAQYRLACCYANGDDVGQDRTTAGMWFEKAAVGGHVSSMVRLGEAHLDVDGISRNSIRGLFWLLEAANRNNSEACRYLAMRYSIGDSLPQSDCLAAKWYRRAANLGSVSEMFSLSRCYAGGFGVEQDSVKAYICLTVATTKAGHHPNLAAAKMSRDGLAEELIVEILRLSSEMIKSGAFTL